jgi:amidase
MPYIPSSQDPPYKAIASRKKSQQLSLIPREWRLPASLLSTPPSSALSVPSSSNILTPLDLEITSRHDATSLAAALRSRTYTAVAVTTAFCKRAAIAHQLTNCLTEIFFSDALTRAKYLDSELARTGSTVGPLHGVPVSLKDTFKVKGYDASIGIASLAENPATEDALLVKILLEQGAVLYCKTNIPQTLMALDSDNNVFGRVINPLNRLVTAGGSSGGEGALVAMRGSVLGVGTDVGGSIRIPAMCNGVYGIKPSAARVPYVGQQNGTRPGAGQVSLLASAGPIAVSLRDCELFLKTVAGARPWERDPGVVYGKWDDQGSVGQKPLLGVLRSDGVTEPLPPITKVLDETVGMLREAGIEVIEISSPAFSKCQSLTNKFFGIDGGNHMFDLLDKTSEPLTTWLSTRLRRGKQAPLDKLAQLHAQKAALETEMLKIWTDPKTGRPIDAIICPVAPHPVPPIDRWNGVGYTSSFVLLDYPAGSLPVREVREEDLHDEWVGNKAKPLGSWDKANKTLCKLFYSILFCCFRTGV